MPPGGSPVPAPPSPPPPLGVCGPNVTQQVRDAVANTRAAFPKWAKDIRSSACKSLVSLLSGGYAWDISELHNNAWILDYRPECATQGNDPPCGSSVQIDDACHYAGSVNYVIFGVMCKLCQDHFTALGERSSIGDFTEAEMLKWISRYKGAGFTGLSTPSGNFDASNQWALAGNRGWPAGKSPAGDRGNCSPSCAKAHKDTFTVKWAKDRNFLADDKFHYI